MNATMADQTRPDQTRPDSSFFHFSYSDRKVLVIVPHQDDEINVAAVSIQNFVHSGAEVFVLFATNGDYEVTADTRLQEAADSLSVLGVDRSHIFCLGYADTLNHFPGGHIFYSENDTVASPHGSTETYGGAGFQDFAYTFRHEHSSYCAKNYRRDLKDAILQIRADIILSVDFDFHSDHRMLSLSFEAVMGEILSRPDNDYRPEVFKRFGYSTAFLAVKDFFKNNLKETQRPSEMGSEIIDVSCYSWDKRIRIPVPEKCRVPMLSDNLIADALKKHVSQDAFVHADGIINSDEVFWPRRTDSLSYSAKITASSGDTHCVNDFRLLNVTEIDSDSPEWANYLWVPEPDDKVKELSFHWEKGHDVSRIVLWGNIDGQPVKRVNISMNTGYDAEFGPLPEHGLPLVLDIPAQHNVTELVIKILDQGSPESGFAEIEIFEHKEQPPVLMPFIQVLGNGNFIYDYLRATNEHSIAIDCYSYRVSSPVHYDIKGPAHFEGNNLIFEDDKSDVVLTASTIDDKLFCRSVFRAPDKRKLEAMHSHQRHERINLIALRIDFKAKRYMKILKEKGIVYFIGKVIKKLKGGRS